MKFVVQEQSASDQTFQTPMMQQYMELKAQYPECVLFFRLGDFYELFLEDAQIGAQILGITLTRRTRGKDGHIPMCGVPYHAVELYIPKLIAAGKKIAIAEQVTLAKDSPQLVKRAVVRVITPATLIDGSAVNHGEHAYVCTVILGKKSHALACADVATGDFFVQSCTPDQLSDTLHTIRPKEIILSPEMYNTPTQLGLIQAAFDTNISAFIDWQEWVTHAESILCRHFRVHTLSACGFDDPELAKAASAVLGYLSYTQHGQLAHCTTLYTRHSDQTMLLDPSTIASLEIFTTTQYSSDEGSLFGVIDMTKTAAGKRLLHEWLAHPLVHIQAIEERLSRVEWCTVERALTQILRTHLQSCKDSERLLSKLAVGIGNARDLLALAHTLQVSEEIVKVIHKTPLAAPQYETLQSVCHTIAEYILEWIVPEPPALTKIGGMIKRGNVSQLDELQDLTEHQDEWLQQYEAEQRQLTQISTLKVKSNSIFGFFIEVPNGQVRHLGVRPEYIRQQTLVNAQRYTTLTLQQHYSACTQAQEQRTALEYELFMDVVRYCVDHSTQIQSIASHIAELDCITNLAQLALERHYVRPTLTTTRSLQIVNGRHPVIEKSMRTDFVPNSTHMDDAHNFALITGPNMAGKSTYIRHVALIIIMAQIGSFVPADQAIVPICTRIFSRIGASDALHKGLSTFMVEMSETARILHHIDEHSLVIIDEIGRGTSTIDGMSIAQAVAEHLATSPKHPFVFFATHYHELSQLAQSISTLKNYSMEVKLHKGKILFLHKLTQRHTQESYGVEVAQLAGLPKSVIQRAEHLKYHYCTDISTVTLREDAPSYTTNSEVERAVRSLSLNEVSPKQALEILFELQSLLHHTKSP